MFKHTCLVLALAMAAPVVASAAESRREGTNAEANDVKRKMKKGAHRVEEAVCMEGDAKCAAKKVGNRAEEAKDATKDKAKEVRDKIDADGKAGE